MKAEGIYIEPGNEMRTQARAGLNEGIKAGIPIAVGYVPIAIAFGLLAKSSGLPNYVSLLMSLFIFAGASQFVGANLIALGASFGEIILTTFILNLRHFLMTASISQRIESGTAKKWMALLAFGVTDETFTVAALRAESKLGRKFVLGLNFTAFAAWNVGTWAGVFLASGLPDSIKTSMGIALYSMFIGLLLPSMKKSRPILMVAMASVSIHSILHWLPLFSSLSTGWSIIISTILAAAAGAIIFPGGKD
ncbi:AzlC family ABC transporter permease [Aneurinibacillus sp. Ricciae_BoGa-3]|uniref:AzlC family ABC transporter permease n=1 Tax=Aneurinibacillus sp. Ricciae_BoGa-3 TaxID=3022697 RepID=UPI0023402C54|nr:AzlC family ABC transporter permease [Aneurinibacillus sp. Ricciae_BoGa-3]WCK55807.1 AzlC family ABC transporter permease [Aneurinibacillus sp. Ricciae_BoGa-3]